MVAPFVILSLITLLLTTQALRAFEQYPLAAAELQAAPLMHISPATVELQAAPIMGEWDHCCKGVGGALPRERVQAM